MPEFSWTYTIWIVVAHWLICEDRMKTFKQLIKEGTYKVEIQGLPTVFISSDNPAEIKRKLRKIVKRSEMIDNVERVQKSDVRKHFQIRLRDQDIEGDDLEDDDK